MTEYQKISVGLSEKQRKSIAQAIEAGSGVKLRLSYDQLHQNNSHILVTKTQLGRIEKAKSKGKGLILNISKRQLDKMKSGGFIPMLLGALVSSLAPVLFQRIFPDKNNNEGSGINMPGTGISIPGSGINLPRGRGQAKGFIVPDNGGNTSYRIEGFSAKNAGSGMVLPGSKTARTTYKSQKAMNALPTETNNLPITTVKKKRQPKTLNTDPVGMGYIYPNSQNFQMLE